MCMGAIFRNPTIQSMGRQRIRKWRIDKIDKNVQLKRPMPDFPIMEGVLQNPIRCD